LRASQVAKIPSNQKRIVESAVRVQREKRRTHYLDRTIAAGI
jgi:hypothetical protein